MVKDEKKPIIRLLEEYEVKEEPITGGEIEKELGDDIDKEIEEDIDKEIEKEERRGRPTLTGKEKIERALERKLAKQKLEEEFKKEPRTPYVGGILPLEDSGGWCLTESKTVTTVVDRRTGKKTVMINGLEVDQR